MKNSIEKRYRAIKQLVKHGYRGTEWAEAGLLKEIEHIIDDDTLDLSSNGLKHLMEKAGKN